jgi:hypothetical protein
MKKTEAISMLGGDVASAAKALGISYQAVNKWPAELPQRISDRVLGAYARLRLPEICSSANNTKAVA